MPTENLLSLQPLADDQAEELDRDGSVLPRGVKLREFGDVGGLRQSLYDAALEGASRLPKLQNARHSMELADVKYEGKDRYTPAEEKKAILTNTSLFRRLRGTWRVKDNQTGQPISERRMTVAHVPYLTGNGTIIRNGVEYAVNNQQRLLSGVFTRQRDDGELESHVNVLPGQGFMHRYYLDPETGVFRAQVQQASLPLLPLLRLMGAKDEDIQEAWGDDLFKANQKIRQEGQVLGRLYSKFVGRDPASVTTEQQREAVQQALGKVRMDPEVNRVTLGQPFDRLDSGSMLAITKKLLSVSRGESETDDRDDLANQTIMGPEDLLRERITRDASGELRKAFHRASFLGGKLDRMPTAVFNRSIESLILKSGLGISPEEVNPAELLDRMYRVTRMGAGGITSDDSVPDDSRNVLPSHLNMIDPVRTPESGRAGVELFFASGARKGHDGRLYSQYRDHRTGKTNWLSAQDLRGKTIAMPGEMAQPDEHVRALQGGKLGYVSRQDVDLEPTHFERSFSPLGNLVPFKSTMKPHRMAMGARMLTQAVALAHPESQLVRTAMPDGSGKSYAEHYGTAMGAIRAEGPAIVQEVTPDAIVLKTQDGQTKRHDLYNNYVYNRRSFLHQTPAVKPGETVQPGQLLARSNYTDDKGAMALGVNARVAFVPFRSNYEDAIVVSESLAKKMTSHHAYQETADWDESVKRGRNTFASLFPRKYKTEQLGKLDEQGSVKPGTEVNYGDPLFLGVKKTPTTKDKVHRAGSATWEPVVVEWHSKSPAVVTDVVHTDKGSLAVLKTAEPLRVGDKASQLFGGKGVVSCYDEETEVFTRRGWLRFSELTSSDKVAVWNDGKPKFSLPEKFVEQDYSGELFGCRHDRLDYLVTPNHRMWVRIEHFRGHAAKYKFRTAAKAYGMRVTHLCSAKFGLRRTCGTVRIPACPVRGRQAKCQFRATDFYAFMGWYLSEGSLGYYENRSCGKSRSKVTSYKIQIAQSQTVHPENCRKIEEVLTSMGVGWHYSGCQYTFSNKALYLYLKPLGLCDKKYVYRELIEKGGSADLQELLDALILGDGRVDGPESRSLFTTSQRLAEDAAEVGTLLGLQSIVRPTKKPEDEKPQWMTSVSTRSEVGWGRRGSHYRCQYEGKVFCLQVPGGLLYVRRNGKPFWCGNSIVPDSQMPQGQDGKPFEILLDPGSLISRTNTSQVYEALLGKIASKTGQPYALEDFGAMGDVSQFVDRELAKHKIDKHEDLLDPETKRKIPRTLTGVMHFIKLHHQAEHKAQGRGISSYTSEDAPAKSGEESSKRNAAMHTSSLLSHGALNFLSDVKLNRGQRRDEAWSKFMQGHPPGAPKVPLIYEKFLAELQGAGIQVVPDGPRLHIKSLTDKAVEELAGDREIRNSETVRIGRGGEGDYEAIEGGLFDPKLTGSHGGGRWSFVRLDEPMPNPIMADPIRKLLGLTGKRFEAVLFGQEELGGRTGPAAIHEALKGIDIDKEIKLSRERIESGKKTWRDDAIKRLEFLKASRRTGTHPSDWMLTRVPVLPPRFRPISKMEATGLPIVSDPNYLYKSLIDSRDNFRELHEKVDDVSQERKAIYRNLEAVTGLGDPVQPELRDKNVKGLLSGVLGSSPKFGRVQRQLIATPVDLVGRAVITPDPDMDMDQVGLPEDKAWSLYRPFVIRRLTKRGMGLERAVKEFQDRTKLARQEIVEEMQTRPVVIDRAPVLHKLGMQAAWPKLVPGSTLRISPLVTKGFGADFDGDQMNFHVPFGDDAVRDAVEKLMPSRNLLSAADFKTPVSVPQQMYLAGLYLGTRKPDDKRPAASFSDQKSVIRAFLRGELDADQPVEIPT